MVAIARTPPHHYYPQSLLSCTCTVSSNVNRAIDSTITFRLQLRPCRVGNGRRKCVLLAIAIVVAAVSCHFHQLPLSSTLSLPHV